MQLSGPEIQKLMKRTVWQKINKQPASITIFPFDQSCLGSNSYDLHIDDKMSVYSCTIPDGMKSVINIDLDDPRFDGIGLEEFNSNREHYVDAFVKRLTMRDWFLNDEYYEDYLKNPQEYAIDNPKFTINTIKKQKPVTEILIPDTGLILSQRFGYLGSTVEWIETYGLFPYIDGKSSGGRHFIKNHFTSGCGDDGFVGNWTLEIEVKAPTFVLPGMRIGQCYYDKFKGKRKPYNLNPASNYRNQSGPTGAAPLKQDPFILEFMKNRDLIDKKRNAEQELKK